MIGKFFGKGLRTLHVQVDKTQDMVLDVSDSVVDLYDLFEALNDKFEAHKEQLVRVIDIAQETIRVSKELVEHVNAQDEALQETKDRVLDHCERLEFLKNAIDNLDGPLFRAPGVNGPSN